MAEDDTRQAGQRRTGHVQAGCVQVYEIPPAGNVQAEVRIVGEQRSAGQRVLRTGREFVAADGRTRIGKFVREHCNPLGERACLARPNGVAARRSPVRRNRDHSAGTRALLALCRRWNAASRGSMSFQSSIRSSASAMPIESESVGFHGSGR